MKTYVIIRRSRITTDIAPLPFHVEEVQTDELFPDLVNRISKEVKELLSIRTLRYERETVVILGTWDEIHVRERAADETYDQE